MIKIRKTENPDFVFSEIGTLVGNKKKIYREKLENPKRDFGFLGFALDLYCKVLQSVLDRKSGLAQQDRSARYASPMTLELLGSQE